MRVAYADVGAGMRDHLQLRLQMARQQVRGLVRLDQSLPPQDRITDDEKVAHRGMVSSTSREIWKQSSTRGTYIPDASLTQAESLAANLGKGCGLSAHFGGQHSQFW